MKLKLAGIFKDHMVLQRDMPFAVFGTGAPGTEISVCIHTGKSSALVRDDGRWCVYMPPLCGGQGYRLTVCDGCSTVEIADVAVGEVWLAGGQSNMELSLAESENGIAECRKLNTDKLRVYQVPKYAVTDACMLQQEEASEWEIVSEENVGQMSGVAYYFARQLAQKTDCIVGIIECFWGGSSIACWMSRRMMLSVASGQRQFEEYAALAGEKTAEEYASQMEEYNASVDQWQERVDAYRKEKPDAEWPEICGICGDFPWPQPVGWQSPFCPNNLYTSMISRIVPYTLRGVLYYQGEEDVVRYAGYSDMMTALVKQWRMDWNDWNLPFLFVQLPMYLAAGEPDDRIWAWQREQQEIASRMLKNTGMITLTDCGEYDNIHPLDKKTPGERLFRLAERMVYGDGNEITPTVRYLYTDGEALYITFFHVEGSLQLRETEKPAFALAGTDHVFREAIVQVIGRDTIKVSCDQIRHPATVRYAWYNFGEAALFAGNGMPVPTFQKSIYPPQEKNSAD